MGDLYVYRVVMLCIITLCLPISVRAENKKAPAPAAVVCPPVDPKATARDPKSVLKAEETTKRRNVEMLTLGVNYIFPSLRFEHGIARHWTVGVTSLFLHQLSTFDESLKGYGAAVGVTYYLKNRFRGGWVELAPTINLLKSTASGQVDSRTNFSVLGTVGWRWAWTSGLNIGTGFGAHYFFHSEDTPVDVSRLLPSFVLDIGFTF